MTSFALGAATTYLGAPMPFFCLRGADGSATAESCGWTEVAARLSCLRTGSYGRLLMRC